MIRCLGSDATAIYVLAADEIDPFRQQNSARLWVDLIEPTDEDLRWLGRSFALQSSNLADVEPAGTPDYIEAYPSYLFGSAYHPERLEGELYGHRSHFFLAPKFLITIQTREDPRITTLWQKIRTGVRALAFWARPALAGAATALASRLSGDARQRAGGSASNMGMGTGRKQPPACYSCGANLAICNSWPNGSISLLQQLRQLKHPGLDANVQHRLGRPHAQLTDGAGGAKTGRLVGSGAMLDYQEKRRQTMLLQWLLVAVVLGILSFWLAQLLGLLGLGG